MSVPEEKPKRAFFPTTRWSVVFDAQAGDRDHSERARAALGELCRIYWPPVYAFVRSRGYAPHDAEDATQDFFAKLIGRDSFATVGEGKGKLRTFLLVALQRFLINDGQRKSARKRGGGIKDVPINAEWIEPRIAATGTRTPEESFDFHWAVSLLDDVLSRLSMEYLAQGRDDLFGRLKSTIAGDRSHAAYAEIAMELNMTEGAIRVAAHRLRRRYREILLEEIGRTVGPGSEAEEELDNLFHILCRH